MFINIAPKAETESCVINLSYKSSKIVPCLHLALSKFVLICHFRQDLELPHFDSLDKRGLNFSLLVCYEASCSFNYVTNLLQLTLEKNSHGPVTGSFCVDEVCSQCRQCKMKVNGIWVPNNWHGFEKSNDNRWITGKIDTDNSDRLRLK